MRRRPPADAQPLARPAPVPRDVEAVEAVINPLDAGIDDSTVTNSAQAHRVIVTTLTGELGIAYAAAWRCEESGDCTLIGEVGRFTDALRRSGFDRLKATEGQALA